MVGRETRYPATYIVSIVHKLWLEAFGQILFLERSKNKLPYEGPEYRVERYQRGAEKQRDRKSLQDSRHSHRISNIGVGAEND